LDSKLESPQIIGQESDLLNYLKEELDCREKELFLVVTNDIGKDQAWLKNETTYSNNLQEREAEVLQLKDIISDDSNITINPLCNNKLEWS
jgi:josephin